MAAGETPGLPQAREDAYSAKHVKDGKSARQSRMRQGSKRRHAIVNVTEPKDSLGNLQCPECGSKRLYRDGSRYLSSGESVQRWLCRDCGFRFSESTTQRQVKVNVSGKVLEGF